MRRARAVLVLLLAVGLAACADDEYGTGCTGRTCKVTFHGTGTADLGDELDPGTKLRLDTIDDASVTGRLEHRNVKLVLDEKQRVGRYDVTLRRIDGDDVDVRIER